jgi:basic amino acid/polyamine antiporter, APA family
LTLCLEAVSRFGLAKTLADAQNDLYNLSTVGEGAIVANAQPLEGESRPAPGDDRRFGYWVGHFVVVGSMIGSGILTTSGYTLRDTGNPSALMGLWVLGGLLAICGAVSVAELATALPRSGGDYVFVREAFGRDTGFVSGWATFILGFTAPTAVIAHLSITYLAAPFTSDLAAALPTGIVDLVVPIGASALILAMGVTHSLGHRHSSRLQLAATILTASILTALACGGMLFGRGDWNHFSVGGWPTGNQWPALAAGLIGVGFAYGGWNAAGYLAGEIQNPARTLPRCLIGGVATVMVLYLLVNLAYVFALDPIAMTQKTEDDVKPVAKLAVDAMFGSAAAGVVSIALGLGLMATVSAALLTGPRIAYAMAQDGVFPGFAGRLHATRRTPIAATFIHAAVAIVLVWSGSFRELFDYAAIGFVAISGLTVASVFAIHRRKDLPHPYRSWLYPLPPVIYLGFIGWTIGSALLSQDQLVPALCSLGTILIGIPIARLIRKPIGTAK